MAHPGRCPEATVRGVMAVGSSEVPTALAHAVPLTGLAAASLPLALKAGDRSLVLIWTIRGFIKVSALNYTV